MWEKRCCTLNSLKFKIRLRKKNVLTHSHTHTQVGPHLQNHSTQSSHSHVLHLEKEVVANVAFFWEKQPLHVKYYFNIVVFLQNVYKWGPPGTKKKVLKQKKISPFRASRNNLHVNCCVLTRKDICGCFLGCWWVSSSAADNTSNTAQSLSKDKKKYKKQALHRQKR